MALIHAPIKIPLEAWRETAFLTLIETLIEQCRHPGESRDPS